MFALKGWSITTDKPKLETATPATYSRNNDPSQAPAPKKRKKKHAGGTTQVTDSNVADLWEKVVEGKQELRREKGASKSSRSGAPEYTGSEKEGGLAREDEATDGDKEKPRKKRKRGKKPAEKGDKNEADPESLRGRHVGPGPSEAAPIPTESDSGQPPAEAPTLTPLQQSMRNKLVSARFRHLNEALYTKPSGDAYQMFRDSPEMFSEYHEGFRRQVAVWPENPIDGYISAVRERAGKQSAAAAPHARGPLPRTNGKCTIADLGCGDAALSKALRPDAKRLRLRVLSFDLQGNPPLITQADIASLPLADGSVDVALFCLALMGTNWVEFVEEAYRVLRWKGELWVAETKSRFGRPGAGGRRSGAVGHSVGKKRKSGGAPGRPAAGAEAVDLDDPTAETDGTADDRQETDVSAFVDVLAKRGFVLAGPRDAAVDVSNKMFVKMHFVKEAQPTRGKGARAHRGRERGKPAFIDRVDEDDGGNEAVLKPCVYKLR